MNLQVPVGDGKSTEIDLLLIHETGLYVFEIKHYKGTIYGKFSDKKWTQYFRTASNNSFQNPILQNQYHIKALKSKFPDIPIHIDANGEDERIEYIRAYLCAVFLWSYEHRWVQDIPTQNSRLFASLE